MPQGLSHFCYGSECSVRYSSAVFSSGGMKEEKKKLGSMYFPITENVRAGIMYHLHDTGYGEQEIFLLAQTHQNLTDEPFLCEEVIKHQIKMHPVSRTKNVQTLQRGKITVIYLQKMFPRYDKLHMMVRFQF